jgi:TonB family protein
VAQVSPLDSVSSKVAVVALSPPIYSQMARVANIWGDVSVTLTIRPDGTVESAEAMTGNSMLRQAALDSARQTRFECRGCRTATKSYQMLYTFRMVESGDCCNALSVPPTIEVQSPSLPSHEAWQTQVIITAEHSCICDPVVTITRKRVRSPKCLYLWKCSTRCLNC